MKIVNLNENPLYVESVAGWIYKEFIENIKKEITYERIVNKFNTTKKDTIPCTLVAIENDICIGTASLFENDLKARQDLSPWLSALYVEKKYRDKGIGRNLIEEITKLAKDLGYDRIYLRTEHASQYYRSLGWESIYKTVDTDNLKTEVFSKKID